VSEYEKMSEALQKGKADEVKDLVNAALEAGSEPKSVLEEGLIAGMNIIGGKFKRNEIYIPEVLIAARAMHAGMSVLEPLLVASGVKMVGKLIIGTVKGDLHDIGKNLVGMMFKGAGFEVVDLSTDVAPEKFVESAADHHHDPDEARDRRLEGGGQYGQGDRGRRAPDPELRRRDRRPRLRPRRGHRRGDRQGLDRRLGGTAESSFFGLKNLLLALYCKQ
jgi:hypothetical protein